MEGLVSARTRGKAAVLRSWLSAPRSMEGSTAGLKSPKGTTEDTASSGHPVPLCMGSPWEADEGGTSPPLEEPMGQKRLPPVHERKLRIMTKERTARER